MRSCKLSSVFGQKRIFWPLTRGLPLQVNRSLLDVPSTTTWIGSQPYRSHCCQVASISTSGVTATTPGSVPELSRHQRRQPYARSAEPRWAEAASTAGLPGTAPQAVMKATSGMPMQFVPNKCAPSGSLPCPCSASLPLLCQRDVSTLQRRAYDNREQMTIRTVCTLDCCTDYKKVPEREGYKMCCNQQLFGYTPGLRRGFCDNTEQGGKDTRQAAVYGRLRPGSGCGPHLGHCGYQMGSVPSQLQSKRLR